ncbi:Type II secretion system protein F [Stieleria maiorica]|uniref:Type II secretion system protein F n=1 Tax=Stieleria maiorica TaxID=2795974 RepID=A0A5B9MLY1_9BACT|nr:type II secretion system F family protein [Stieleria maiorica]QEG01021.1 Type II secretion system protein F [Stieleria maiorica]
MLFRRMGIAAAAGFCRRMGIGLRAGADLLRLLKAETKYGSPRQREAVSHVLESVEAGFQISDAMKQRAAFFPRLMVSLTRVGESTGKLERTFNTLADHFDQQVALRRLFLTSIAWPVIQLGLGLGVISIVIYLMGILTPSTGGQMADILGFGLRGGKGVLIFWGYIACVAAILWSLYFAYQKNLGGVQNLVPLLYMVPKLGPSLQTITLSRFTRTLSLALGAGLDPIRSVKLSLDSTDSDYYRGGGELFESAIRDRGDTLAGGLRSTDLFPEPFLHLVEVAEMSGTESESIDHLAVEYEERAKMAMRTLSGVATGIIWMAVAGTLIFFIFRMASVYLGAINEAAGLN